MPSRSMKLNSADVISLRSPIRPAVHVLVEAGIEVRQPLPVDVRLEDAANLEEILLARGRRRKPISTTRLILASMLSTQPGLVGRRWQVQPEHLHDLLAGQHQPGLGTAGVELGQPLAQQSQEHTGVEGQGPPGDQPGQFVPVVDSGSCAGRRTPRTRPPPLGGPAPTRSH